MPLVTAAREEFSELMRIYEGLAIMEPVSALSVDRLRIYWLVAGVVPLQQLEEGSGVVEVAFLRSHLGHRRWRTESSL